MQLLHSFVGKSFYSLFCSQVGSGPSDQYPNLAFLNSLLEELLLSCHWKQLFQCHTNLQQDLQIWLQTASESHGQFFTPLSHTHQESMTLLHQAWWPVQGCQQPKMNWSQRKNKISKTGNYFSNISLALKGKEFSFWVASYSHLSCFTIEIGSFFQFPLKTPYSRNIMCSTISTSAIL